VACAERCANTECYKLDVASTVDGNWHLSQWEANRVREIHLFGGLWVLRVWKSSELLLRVFVGDEQVDWLALL
jgi:hypothetical protein